MAERILDETESATLYGATDTDTNAVFPDVSKNNWGGPRNRMDQTLIQAARLSNDLRPFESDANDTTIGVHAGRLIFEGVELAFATEEIDLSAYNNDTAYLWIESDGGGGLQLGAAADGTGWPATAHVKLFEVTLAAGNFDVNTDVVDKRCAMIYRMAAACADLAVDISAGYVEAEIQSLADKIDELQGVLRAANLLAP